MIKIEFVRLWRIATRSCVTYSLPHPMTIPQAKLFIKERMSGWEMVCGSRVFKYLLFDADYDHRHL
jgi:hypothetical protein